MPDFIFAYHGGAKPESEEEGKAMMMRWMKWVEDMGDAMINPGTPVGMSKTVSASGVEDHGGPDPLMGFSVVRSDSMEAVLEHAKNCPHLEIGTIEVAEMIEMKPPE